MPRDPQNRLRLVTDTTEVAEPFDMSYALLPDSEELVNTVVQVRSDARGDAVATIEVNLTELDDRPGQVLLDIKIHGRNGGARDFWSDVEIHGVDLLRLSRAIHRAAARAQRLGIIPVPEESPP